MRPPRRRSRLRASIALVVALVVGVAVLPGCGLVDDPAGPFQLTADFSRGTGLYPGSPVRVLGIDVGRITDVADHDGRVRVQMRLRSGVRLPAAVDATIVPLTLLGERYVQLGPAYSHGPLLRSGAHIPISRTTVPAEFDDLLRGLQTFVGSIDPNKAGDVVTDLADLLAGRGASLNSLIHHASGTLGLLADKGDQLRSIISSLGELSQTLQGRTDDIASLVRNYDLVSEVLVQNKDDLDATITELDRATKELSSLLVAHERPLRADVAALTETGRTVDANTDNLELTLSSTVKLFQAASRAYDPTTNALAANNQLAPDVTSALVAARLRDRIAGLCRRLGISVCADPASPLLNGLAGTLPGILGQLGSGAGLSGTPISTSGAPRSSTAKPAAPSPADATPPSSSDLVALLASQLTDKLGSAQSQALAALDPAKLTALLGLDPTLLQVLPKLDAAQLDRLRTATTEQLGPVLLSLLNAVEPPSSRLAPLLPGSSGTTSTTAPGGGPTTTTDPLPPWLGGLLGGL